MNTTKHYNKGHYYEMEVAESFGVKPPLGGHGSDLELGKFSVEIKSGLGGDFGQGGLGQDSDGKWMSTAKSPIMQDLLYKHSTLCSDLNDQWGAKIWKSGMRRTDIYAKTITNAAGLYYHEKGDAYVFIKGYGLYRTMEDDPANTNAPILIGQCSMRARIKCHSKTNSIYRPNYAIKIKNLAQSPVTLDALR